MGKFNYTIEYKCGHTKDKVHYFSGEQLLESMELNLAKQVNNALYQDCADCQETAKKDKIASQLKERTVVQMKYWEYNRAYRQFKLVPNQVIRHDYDLVSVMIPDKHRKDFNRLWSGK